MRPRQRTTRRPAAIRPAIAPAIASAAAVALILALSPAPAFAAPPDDGTGVTLGVRIEPIDTSAPTVEIDFSSSSGGNNGNGNGKPKSDDDRPGKANGKRDEYTAKSEVQVTVNARDAGPGPVSGIAAVEVSLDGGPWLPYTEPFGVTAHGKHKVSARAIDVAGNVSDIELRSFKIVGKPQG